MSRRVLFIGDASIGRPHQSFSLAPSVKKRRKSRFVNDATNTDTQLPEICFILANNDKGRCELAAVDLATFADADLGRRGDGLDSGSGDEMATFGPVGSGAGDSGGVSTDA
jgi:hypothetical protein